MNHVLEPEPRLVTQPTERQVGEMTLIAYRRAYAAGYRPGGEHIYLAPPCGCDRIRCGCHDFSIDIDHQGTLCISIGVCGGHFDITHVVGRNAMQSWREGAEDAGVADYEQAIKQLAEMELVARHPAKPLF